MPYPVFYGGQPFTAALAAAIRPVIIEKQADTSRASNVTLANDPELSLPVVPGIWFVQMEIVADADVAADIKTAWSAPSGTVGNKRLEGPGSSSTDANDNTTTRWGVSGLSTAIPYGARASAFQFHFRETAHLTIVNSGNVVLQWAQQVSNAAATTVYSRSMIMGWRLS